MTARQGAILTFWFADAAESHAALERQSGLWFGGDLQPSEISAQDAFIRHAFGADVESAARGELDDWADTPRGRLALIILLDQFRRNIYRGTAEAFAGDAAALELTTRGMAIGADRVLTALERLFLYMPLQHAESLTAQEQSVAVFRSLAREARDEQRWFFESLPRYAEAHRDIIRRFGRFPHRNAILARESTIEEQEYLAGDVPHFGQRT